MLYKLVDETRFAFAMLSQVSPLFAVYVDDVPHESTGAESSTTTPEFGAVTVLPGSEQAHLS